MERILTEKTPDYLGKSVRLFGWVQNRRDHGKLIFIDLKDRSGIVQLVINPEEDPAYKKAEELRNHWVIEAIGTVAERPQGTVNEKIATGKVEVKVRDMTVLSRAAVLPFSVKGDGYDVSEEKRLRFRYLDLRRKRLQKNIRARNKAILFIRNYLEEEGFIEIETPILTKSSPEGARDFLVPSRI